MLGLGLVIQGLGFGFDEVQLDPTFGFDIKCEIGSVDVNINKEPGIEDVTLNQDLAFGDLWFEKAKFSKSSDSEDFVDDVHYSDHLYAEDDDDDLYETYVDGQEKCDCLANTFNKGKEVNANEDVLNDGHSKYGSEYSCGNTSDEDNGKTTKLPFKHFKPGTEDPHFKIGMLFGNIEQFKKAVKQYAIKNQRAIELVKNDKRRIREDESVGQARFNRLYILLGSVKSRFLNGCRKIIGVDGCLLKGQYSKKILATVLVDLNNAMYPMAWAVVEKEDKDTWGWFITLMKIDCGITDDNDHEWTFINGRQKVYLFYCL
ncbi:hypothetical protein Vadar_003100 [Vaccinium darrowii]|uniref:Uncharacterized protein n=1 Tax=Vaccinium darrowii TaxID=229202 RepID=A0ACB7XEY8_9ERIC|nr:hypothetical protein Vadar_003100 [Vaccinium darrowii]